MDCTEFKLSEMGVKDRLILKTKDFEIVKFVLLRAIASIQLAIWLSDIIE